MSKVPDYIKENIYQTVKADLEPGRFHVHAKVGSSVAIGGAISLFFCGQMGLGLSSLAHSVHAVLMQYGGDIGCTIVCGVVFALVPVVILRLLTSSIQFQIVLFRERFVISGWVAAFGGILAIQSQGLNGLGTIALWAVPATLSFYLFGWALRKVLIGPVFRTLE